MPGRLTVHRPTPTTASFTVSNAPRRSDPTAKVLFAFGILLRVLSFLCVIAVAITRARHHFFEEGSFLTIAWEDVWSSAAGRYACQLVDSYNPSVLAIAGTLILYGESLLVIRGFGIQTSTSSSTYLSTAATRFIPTTQIQDIVIHEAFKGFEVRFYLAVIVEGEPGVLVVFPQLLPGREVLEEVWRGSRRCLYDTKS
ncbi:hypothetical protein N7539_001631 [Penicillium diatomitis]|uniref:Phosphatidylinositol N-acetylglucosaminyltransferase subunit H conserved domain-containing protein n=1 Tax=Penicillium diatomitis TaxID=2819901 RepID=A0A9W9XHT7_9EURO|nr:uncharacterized protein N7539_001631 [Penicillium diatomitis]KAJ5492885.1 hypothetical protein N7539_001631 [Penicillium diatomitis]